MTYEHGSNVKSSDLILFGLYGAGGFAREIMPLLVQQLDARQDRDVSGKYQLYFVETLPGAPEVNGYPVISEEAFFNLECKERQFNIAIGDATARQAIAERLIARGARPVSITSVHAVAYDNNKVGEGAILCAHTTITSNATIGKFFHANLYSYVAHDCIVGDFVTFAPNVHCNGNVHIHDHAYIGAGAILKQGSLAKPLIIGKGAVVGMGAVVTKDVAPFTTVVGNPARRLNKS